MTVFCMYANIVNLFSYLFEQQEQNGIVGIAFDTSWYEPTTNSTEDIEAAGRAMEFNLGW